MYIIFQGYGQGQRGERRRRMDLLTGTNIRRCNQTRIKPKKMKKETTINELRRAVWRKDSAPRLHVTKSRIVQWLEREQNVRAD